MYPHVKEKVDKSLAAAELHYQGKTKVRHPLDVIVNDIGLTTVSGMVKNNLNGLRIACYYGCQIVRPFAEFDDQHNPMTMDKLVTALGGEAVDWPLKTRCCGGSLTGTIPEAGLRLNRRLLVEAVKRNAEMIITCCALCQFNLECFQDKINTAYGENIHIPVMYFTQLMGVAFGLSEKDLGIQRLFVKPSLHTGVSKGGVKVHA
jgi:heterodisulfide reductase subunit B